MGVAGIINYRVHDDGTLEGRWTHEDLQGHFATERAWGGTPGHVAGRYNVEIYLTDGQKVFEGQLLISPLGEAFSLTWLGTQLLPKSRSAQFVGIGMEFMTDTLFAAFQEK